MSNVVDLASRRVDRILIETGIIKSDDPALHGRRTYWLEYHPADGGSVITWDGESLAEARRAAAEWAATGTVVSDRDAIMIRAPWMPLSVGEAMAETAHLSTEEFGAYLLLKMAQWQHGKLPQDEDSLARIARLDAASWCAARPVLQPLFGPGWTAVRGDVSDPTGDPAA